MYSLSFALRLEELRTAIGTIGIASLVKLVSVHPTNDNIQSTVVKVFKALATDGNLSTNFPSKMIDLLSLCKLTFFHFRCTLDY